MKKILFLGLVILGLAIQESRAAVVIADSVGITSKGAKKFIIHEVEAGETLFALSRRYGVKIADIEAANSDLSGGLKIGQKILIPYNEIKGSGNYITHVVEPSETLFSLSRKYGVDVESIRKWNSLADNTISVGQKLLIKKGETAVSADTTHGNESSGRKIHVVEPSQTLYSISRMYGVTTDQVVAWNHLSSTNLKIGQKLIVSLPLKETGTTQKQNSSMLPAENTATTHDESPSAGVVKEETKSEEVKEVAVLTTTKEKPKSIDTSEELKAPAEKVVEKGMAEVIENSTDTKKYLALHRSAPIGTIMQVKNMMNNQSVFVRVVGQIPPTGDNSKVILKISKKAFDRLGAVDPRFPVEISYIP